MIAQPVERPETQGDKLIGIPYTQEWIPADQLEIGPSYQRGIDVRWVKQIAAEFDPFLLDDLLVNRDLAGRMIVMDGQHRLLAIREIGWGDQNVPCKVYDNLPEELQAKRFNVTDARKKLKAADRFRAALVANDPDARMIESIVHEAGYSINLDNGDTDRGRISAVAALGKIHRGNRSGLLANALSLFAEAYGTEHGPTVRVLSGMGIFLGKFGLVPQFHRGRLVQVMQRMTPATIVAEGNDASRVLGYATAEGVAFSIWKAYNLRLAPGRQLPDFRLPVKRARPTPS